MQWLLQMPSGDTRVVSLTDSEVAMLAEECVSIDRTLKAFMPDYNYPALNPIPYLYVEHIGMSR